jgi:hypothetical protein
MFAAGCNLRASLLYRWSPGTGEFRLSMRILDGSYILPASRRSSHQMVDGIFADAACAVLAMNLQRTTNRR